MRTFGDQFVQLSDTITADQSVGRIARMLRAAIRSAYLDIASRESWNYLLKRTQINTITPYCSGSVAFTESTGIITLTGGTWPSWAKSAQLLINRNVYQVQQSIDSTHLLMLPGRQPDADLPSGTAYILVQQVYPVPDDFVELRQLIELERLWPISYLAPEDMLARMQVWFAPTSILFYSILGGSNGLMDLMFSPPPDTGRTYDMFYQARPRLFVLPQPYSQGSCTTSSGSPNVTIVGGSLTTNMAACVFRTGTVSTLPTGVTGDDPYVEEHVIQSVTSTTTFTCEDNLVYSGSGVLYTIDDPIDLEPVSMMTLMDRMCETRLFRFMQPDARTMSDAYETELTAWEAARAADRRLIPRALQGWNGLASLDQGFWGVTPHAAGT